MIFRHKYITLNWCTAIFSFDSRNHVFTQRLRCMTLPIAAPLFVWGKLSIFRYPLMLTVRLFLPPFPFFALFFFFFLNGGPLLQVGAAPSTLPLLFFNCLSMLSLLLLMLCKSVFLEAPLYGETGPPRPYSPNDTPVVPIPCVSVVPCTSCRPPRRLLVSMGSHLSGLNLELHTLSAFSLELHTLSTPATHLWHPFHFHPPCDEFCYLCTSPIECSQALAWTSWGQPQENLILT